VQWLAAMEADRYANELATAQARVASLQREFDADEKQVTALTNQVNATARTGHTLAELDKEQNALSQAQKQRDAKKKELDDAISTLPHAPIPEQIALLPMDAPLAAQDVTDVAADAGPESAPQRESIVQATPTPRVRISRQQARPITPRAGSTPDSPATAAPMTPVATPPARGEIVRHAAAFAVGPDLVVTSADVVAGAQSIRVESSDSTDVFEATVEKTDDTAGLALLKVTGTQLAFLPVAQAFSQGHVDCVGFPEVSLFGGEAQIFNGFMESSGHLSMSRHPRLAGAPLISAGAVVGVELATRDEERNAITFATLDQLERLVEGQITTAQRLSDPRQAVMELTATRSAQ
jgi:hypothetical protein